MTKRVIRLADPKIPESAKARLLAVLDSGQLSPGPVVREFEEKLAELHKAKHCVFVNSGTDALRIAILAMKEKYGWSDGDKVAVPAVTFPATVNVVIQAGLEPHFVDVGMTDYCINAENLEGQYRSPRDFPALKAVIPVHLMGRHCGERIFEVASAHGLKVLEDSCETIGNPLMGDISCHSTYACHHLSTGVGGFALTNDDSLMELMRSYANHGRSTFYIPGYTRGKIGDRRMVESRFQFDRVGYSARGTEFEAALGMAQLPDLAEIICKRRKIHEMLADALGIYLPLNPLDTCLFFPIMVPESPWFTKLDMCLHLEKAGIETRDLMPLINQKPYQDYFQKCSAGEYGFSVAKQLEKEGFYIPCHENMTKDDVEYIAEAFKTADPNVNSSKEDQDRVGAHLGT